MALKRIQDLDPAAPLDGSEIIELEQAGASVRCTAQDIADLGGGGGIPDAPSDGNLYGRKDGDWEQLTSGAVGVQSIVAGSGIAVDDTDPANPVVSAAGAGSGDVVGPGSSVDNTLPRFNGSTGKAIQSSGVAVTDNDEISGYRGHVNRQTGTTYTLQAADSGKIVELANSAAITVTLPNSLPAGWCCTLVQDGAGQVTLSAASGATLKNRQSHTKLAGNGSFATLYVSSNAGTAAAYRFGGDTAA